MLGFSQFAALQLSSTVTLDLSSSGSADLIKDDRWGLPKLVCFCVIVVSINLHTVSQVLLSMG